MDTAELLDRLVRLRRARVGDVRAPHKPLLLLWLFGRFAATGSSAASYAVPQHRSAARPEGHYTTLHFVYHVSRQLRKAGVSR